MNTREALELAGERLIDLRGHTFDVIDLSKPVSTDAAINITKILSKLSPIIGNLIEFNAVEFLNTIPEFDALGEWERQDPGFPDAIFRGAIEPAPGFEIKAWFPLATEITARFRDSQLAFADECTQVVLLAWLPDSLLFGKPEILDVCILSGRSVARARDNHYHNPPDYLVIEPEDTAARTANLQQTNTAGFKWQGKPEQVAEAEAVVASWGHNGREYSPSPEYQARLRDLMGRFKYRNDTNFAKLDRIEHEGVEAFKSRVLAMNFHGRSIHAWYRMIFGDEGALRQELQQRFEIATEPPAGEGLEPEDVFE